MGRNRAIGNRLRAGGSSTDADALGWAAAVTAAGGTYTAAHLAAVSGAIRGFKSNGTWTKRAVYNPFAGDQLTAALIQYKGGVWASAINVNFVAGDYTPATGLTGNGTTKYLDTGLLANTLTLNSTHIAIYNRSSVAGGFSGANDATDALRLASSTADSYQGCAIGGQLTSGAMPTPWGFVVGTRTASNAQAIYRNGSSIASNVAASSALPAVSLFVFARSNSGGAANFEAQAFGSYSFGAGLSAGEAAADYTIEQAFQTAMGRQV